MSTTTETPEQRRPVAEIKRLGEEHSRGGHTTDPVGGCLACRLRGGWSPCRLWGGVGRVRRGRPSYQSK
jgi:hypothetical protein